MSLTFYGLFDHRARLVGWAALGLLLLTFFGWYVASGSRDGAAAQAVLTPRDRVTGAGVRVPDSLADRARGSNTTSLGAIVARWEATWSTDVSASEVNVAHVANALTLIERADAGDLEATVDLIAASSWCLGGGPLVTISERVDGEQRPCFERFGSHLASRERLERANFAWVLRLAAAGVDDATLFASALIRGAGPDLFGGPDLSLEVRQSQRQLLLGQLQTLAERGSADAASELHGHWSGNSAFALRDEKMADYYAALTERLDPRRSLSPEK